MKLNYRIKENNSRNPLSSFTILLIHGLFGDLNNLGMLAKNLKIYYKILQLDLRNHGKSPHANTMSYLEMALDIILLLNNLKINQCIIIGHSIGGKVAMFLCKLIPKRIIKVVILDMAPVSYTVRNKNPVFAAIDNVNKKGIITRKEAFQKMKKYLSDDKVILFLLKSFHEGKWLFNIPIIKNYYNILNDWEESHPWPGDILFIKGELSSYLSTEYYVSIFRQFPQAKIEKIPKSGHWLHYEKPEAVLKKINTFLWTNPNYS
ncbi:alpha/beta fold hydrolase [Blochmannia endosymbiont of Colobopsis nipponica]|uniref:alpha/beta fold hydrolase n=1 Tax=Blochmannia endosymbiont of Colobopsis nipponica TaxID=2681987 RepID=UPI0017842A7E|nr:alpha/beta fold hydrolase [Blochmannia endosymbiont of Colobopsis nipponica]QOI11118.1 alpha/beta fold hydrolase [Blochmannia endosymbiont of Colobopsis nipponica]